MFYDDDLMEELEYFKDTYDSFTNHLWDYLSNNFIPGDFTVVPFFAFNDSLRFKVYGCELDDWDLEELDEAGFECIEVDELTFTYTFMEKIV